MKKMQMALAGLAVATVVGFGASTAEARRGHGSHYSFGFSTGGYGYPAPAYYAPRPVVYPAYSYYPAPAYVAPAPVYPVYAPAYGPSFSFSYSR